jgi:hypothetical protein
VWQAAIAAASLLACLLFYGPLRAPHPPAGGLLPSSAVELSGSNGNSM